MNSRSVFLIFFIGLFTSFIASAANNPAPRATVDRTVINEGESFTLSIRIDSDNSGDEPDYSPLQKDFEVYRAGSNSQTGYSGGHFFSSIEYQATLVPKRSGQLQLPPIAVAGAHTQPITIQVNPPSQTSSVDGSEPVFIETKADGNSVYVQQQILLTARVYVAVQLDNMQLTKPSFDNANVKQLSETTFNRSINGTPYEVHELVYAIFPQQPGELTIPELVFNAVEITGGRSMFDFPGRGRAIRKMSKQLTVHVKPIPKNFTGSVWLPARNLTLSESWSGDPHHLTTGDSITRSIAIRADGLLAAQLPKLDEATLAAAKLYADQPKLDDAEDASGAHGKRVENFALIPTRSGSLQLPETRVVWWDVDSDSEKVATLPAEIFSIAAGSNDASQPPSSQPAVQESANNSAPTNVEPASANATLAAPTQTLLWWQIAAAVFALLWLATLILYLRLRKKPRALVASDETATALAGDEKNAWRDFSAACRANNPAAARQQLLQWAALFYRDESSHSRARINGIEQLQHRADDAQITRELQLLDNHLFGTLRDSTEWNGENLLKVVQEFRKRQSTKHTIADDGLPPLYPAA